MRSLFLKDDQAGLLTVKDRILYILVVIFLGTFFLADMPVVNNIAMGLIVLYSFFYNSFSEKKQLLRRRPEIAVMAIFYLLHIVSALVSKDKAEGFSWAVMRLPLLVFPITIGLMYIRPALRERIMYAYAVIITLAVLACFIDAVIRTVSTDDTSWMYNDGFTLLIQKQSIYMALLVNAAFFSIGFLIAKKSPVISKRLLYVCLFILLIGSFLLASRIALTVLFGSIVCIAVWRAVQKKKYLQLGIVVAGMAVAGLLLVTIFPRTLNRFRELNYTKYDYRHMGPESHFNRDLTPDQWNGANIRLAVWSCGWELVKQHPVLGVPLGDKVDRLMEVYAAKHFDFAYNSRRNLHNNYLDVLVTFGIVGLLLFVWGFLFEPLRQCIRKRDLFGIFVIGSFVLSFIPETYFDRSMGSILFGFFISFIISYREPDAKA